jgi:2-oxoglutarate dehydrogenase E2 component (dihydrolipoamide succinyltransferase)
MSQSVNLPALGESVTEGTVTRWLKNVGDHVEVDEPLVEVSTDKVDTEIPSPIAGVIEQILVQEDETVEVGTALVTIGDGSAGGGEEAPAPAEEAPAEAAPAEAAQQEAPAAAPAQEAPATPAPAQEAPATPAPAAGSAQEAPAVEVQAPAAQQEFLPSSVPSAVPSNDAPAPAAEPVAPTEPSVVANAGYVTPLVRKLANERGIDLSTVTGSGVGGRIRKEDLTAVPAEGAPAAEAAAPAAAVEISPLRGTTVPMSRLRKIIA